MLKETIETEDNMVYLEEIRIRNNQNIFLKFNDREEFIDYIVTQKDILEIKNS